MSYGREPHYIYECACGGEPDETKDPPHPKERHVMFGCCTYPVRWDELAQFIAAAEWRGELEELLERGYVLRPELRPCERCGFNPCACLKNLRELQEVPSGLDELCRDPECVYNERGGHPVGAHAHALSKPPARRGR